VQFVEPPRIGFDDEARNLQKAKRLGDVPADAPASDNDDVIGDAFVRGPDVFLRSIERAPHGGPASQLLLDGPNQLEHQRIDGDRDQCAGENQRVVVGRKQPEVDAALAEDERELADLTAARPDDERRPRRIRKQERAGDRERELSNHDQS
jgi:hypothetical protein